MYVSVRLLFLLCCSSLALLHTHTHTHKRHLFSLDWWRIYYISFSWRSPFQQSLFLFVVSLFLLQVRRSCICVRFVYMRTLLFIAQFDFPSNKFAASEISLALYFSLRIVSFFFISATYSKLTILGCLFRSSAAHSEFFYVCRFLINCFPYLSACSILQPFYSFFLLPPPPLLYREQRKCR